MKEFFSTATGVIGGIIAAAMGGVDGLAKALLWLMIFDYVSGWLVATVFHKSPKTESGGYASNIGLKGLVRKAMMFGVVCMAETMDGVLGVAYLRDATIIGFMANESASIFENLGLMGLKLPKSFRAALDVLADKADVVPVSAAAVTAAIPVGLADGIDADTLDTDQLRSVLEGLGLSRTYADSLTRDQLLSELDKMADPVV